MLGSEFKGRWLFMLARGLEGETVLVRGAPSNCLLSCMSCSSPAIGLLENHRTPGAVERLRSRATWRTARAGCAIRSGAPALEPAPFTDASRPAPLGYRCLLVAHAADRPSAVVGGSPNCAFSGFILGK